MIKNKRLSRRGLLSASTVLLSLQSAKGQTPAPAPTTREEDLANARQRIQSNSAALAKVKIPIGVEPAVHFKA
jgi:hypothetical protein